MEERGYGAGVWVVVVVVWGGVVCGCEMFRWYDCWWVLRTFAHPVCCNGSMHARALLKERGGERGGGPLYSCHIYSRACSTVDPFHCSTVGSISTESVYL